MPRTPSAGLIAAASAVLTPGVTYYLDVNATDPGTTGTGTFATTRQPIVFQVVGSVLSNVAAGSVPNPGTAAANFFSIWTLASGGVFKQGGVGNGATAPQHDYAAGAIQLSAA